MTQYWFIIQVINRSHKYKNKYVHRRTSVTLENLTTEEVPYDICINLKNALCDHALRSKTEEDLDWCGSV